MEASGEGCTFCTVVRMQQSLVMVVWESCRQAIPGQGICKCCLHPGQLAGEGNLQQDAQGHQGCWQGLSCKGERVLLVRCVASCHWELCMLVHLSSLTPSVPLVLKRLALRCVHSHCKISRPYNRASAPIHTTPLPNTHRANVLPESFAVCPLGSRAVWVGAEALL